MKITVTGATGNVGGRIVAELLTGGHDVRAVIGPGETPPWRARKGLEVTIASFSDRAAIEAAATGADAYFLMSPPSERQVEWQRTQVDAAVNSGVSRVVKLSAYDTGANSGWNMGRWHWDGELALQESGLPHAVLRPQYFQQNLLLDETTLRAGTLITYIPPGRSVGAVHAGDIADVAATLLTTAPLSGQIVVPTGPVTITTDDAAAAISTALGTPISVDYVEPDRGWRELRAAGRPDWWIADLLAICQQASAEVNDDVAAPQRTPCNVHRRHRARAARPRDSHLAALPHEGPGHGPGSRRARPLKQGAHDDRTIVHPRGHRCPADRPPDRHDELGPLYRPPGDES